jgi:hypothetical protein
LVAAKVGAKHELLFNKPASGQTLVNRTKPGPNFKVKCFTFTLPCGKIYDFTRPLLSQKRYYH